MHPLLTLYSPGGVSDGSRPRVVRRRCGQLGPCVLFLDEIDALGGVRGRGELHEASRRLLATLLRHLDGVDAPRHVALIGATNRPTDLDPALLSRFDVRVPFPPPDAHARAAIFGRYAKHLAPPERAALADASDGLCGRDILDVCKSAERRWVHTQLSASTLLRGGADGGGVGGAMAGVGGDARSGGSFGSGAAAEMGPPPLHVYEESVASRKTAMDASGAEQEAAGGESERCESAAAGSRGADVRSTSVEVAMG